MLDQNGGNKQKYVEKIKEFEKSINENMAIHEQTIKTTEGREKTCGLLNGRPTT